MRNRFATSFGLELAKHRKSILSVVIVYVLSMLVAITIVPAFSGYETFAAFHAMLTLSIFYGTPILALIFGVLFGIALRREPEISVEEVLPAHPVTRVSAAYFASFGTFLCLAGMVIFVLAPTFVGNDSMSDVLKDAIGVGSTLEWWLILLDIHLLSFVLAYWMKQPLLAAGLTAISLTIQGFFLVGNGMDPANLFVYYGGSTSSHSFLRPILLTAGIGFFADMIALRLLAGRIERGRLNWIRAIIIVVCLCLSLPVALFVRLALIMFFERYGYF